MFKSVCLTRTVLVGLLSNLVIKPVSVIKCANLTSQFNMSSASNTDFTVSYVTIDSKEKAELLATQLVESGLAACVNIVPSVTSVYRWKGSVQKDQELLMIVKSHASRLEELTNFVQSHHPYDVPEVISLPIIQGNAAYLNWIRESVMAESKTDL